MVQFPLIQSNFMNMVVKGITFVLMGFWLNDHLIPATWRGPASRWCLNCSLLTTGIASWRNEVEDSFLFYTSYILIQTVLVCEKESRYHKERSDFVGFSNAFIQTRKSKKLYQCGRSMMSNQILTISQYCPWFISRIQGTTTISKCLKIPCYQIPRTGCDYTICEHYQITDESYQPGL